MSVQPIASRSISSRRRGPVRVLSFGVRLAVGGILAAATVFATLDAALPYPIEKLEPSPPSPWVTSRDGVALLATVARDDQWRIPVSLAAIDQKIIDATIAVEDERFHRHPGVDPWSIVRATGQNLAAGEVVSGASTITMQLCRLVEPRPRTLRSKLIESFRALQLERVLSKDQILEQYLNRAPYGGNLVGIEAAARWYFGRGAADLTLAEAALLAGIPQGPAILRPDRHPERARVRRRTVLLRMHIEGMISRDECDRALATPIAVLGGHARPAHGLRPPARDLAPHTAWWALSREPHGGRTTIDRAAQQALVEILAKTDGLPARTDVAAVVIEVETGAIRALVGGLRHGLDAQGGSGTAWVNNALARRSPGSTLKPFIYALAFDRGVLAPDSRVPDRPIERAGWRPRNFDDRFRGEVTVAEALLDSRNVPAILVAEALGLGAVAATIERAGIVLPDDPERRGGLAVVTGALEVTLLDLVAGTATFARGGRALPATLWEGEAVRRARAIAGGEELGTRVFSGATCREIDAILGVGGDRTSPWWMAKTGTSARHRDAWAVGHTGRFAVGVWVGRPAGGGDPSLIGGEIARPILEQIATDPHFRSFGAPPAPVSRPVHQPMRFPTTGDPLRIEHPEADGTWITLDDGSLPLRARAAGGCAPYTWFLDGRHVEASGVTCSLELSVGVHEVRVVDATGAVVKHRLTVRSGAQSTR